MQLQPTLDVITREVNEGRAVYVVTLVLLQEVSVSKYALANGVLLLYLDGGCALLI